MNTHEVLTLVTATDFRPIPAPELGDAVSAGRVGRAYLLANVNRLRKEDDRVRHDQPDSVHQYRVACRRLRSALGTYASLYPRRRARSIRDRLRVMGVVLGQARDAEVMRQRLVEQVESGQLGGSEMVARVTADLTADYRAALERSLQLMSQPGYLSLMVDLVELVAEDPVRGRAAEPAWQVLPELLRADWIRLRERIIAADQQPAGVQQDLALHEVRKGAKRLRYASESMRPVLGQGADQLARTAEKLQEVLGERQDGAVARERVVALAAGAEQAGEQVQGYRRLESIEDDLAHAGLQDYVRVLGQLNAVRPWAFERMPLPGERRPEQAGPDQAAGPVLTEEPGQADESDDLDLQADE